MKALFKFKTAVILIALYLSFQIGRINESIPREITITKIDTVTVTDWNTVTFERDLAYEIGFSDCIESIFNGTIDCDTIMSNQHKLESNY